MRTVKRQVTDLKPVLEKPSGQLIRIRKAREDFLCLWEFRREASRWQRNWMPKVERGTGDKTGMNMVL